MKSFFKGFSLIEIVATIAIITLCIISLISTYYSIYKLQNQTMYSSLLKKKIETRFFTKIYPKIDLYIKNGEIYNILGNIQNDPDLINSIEITQINFTLDDPNITSLLNADLSKADETIEYKAKKNISKITIKFRIIRNNKENQIEVYFPTITHQNISKSKSSKPKPSQSNQRPCNSARASDGGNF